MTRKPPIANLAATARLTLAATALVAIGALTVILVLVFRP